MCVHVSAVFLYLCIPTVVILGHTTYCSGISLPATNSFSTCFSRKALVSASVVKGTSPRCMLGLQLFFFLYFNVVPLPSGLCSDMKKALIKSFPVYKQLFLSCCFQYFFFVFGHCTYDASVCVLLLVYFTRIGFLGSLSKYFFLQI